MAFISSNPPKILPVELKSAERLAPSLSGSSRPRYFCFSALEAELPEEELEEEDGEAESLALDCSILQESEALIKAL